MLSADSSITVRPSSSPTLLNLTLADYIEVSQEVTLSLPKPWYKNDKRGSTAMANLVRRRKTT